MKNTVFTLFIFLNFTISANTYSWQRRIINYERTEYNGGPQNWMITQDKNGWIYCANSDGLLEFDGSRWNLTPIGKGIIRSVKPIENKLYVGSSSEFGYIERDDRGFIKYKSLVEKVENWGGEIWNILTNNSEIFFITDYFIHVQNLKSNKIKLLSFDHKIDCSAIINNTIYLGTTDGIYTISKEDTFTNIKSTANLKGEKIISILPYKGNLLITTANEGLFLLSNNSLNRIDNIATDFIQSNQLFSVSILGSKLALGSVQNGLCICDLENPNYIEVFHLNNGLNNNTILCSYFDSNQNLWLGLDKGLAFIDLNSPLRPMFSTISQIGTGYCSQEYLGQIYFGTNQGIYKYQNNKYSLINKTEGQIWSMNIIDGSLFCSGDNGITVISPTGMYKINVPGAWETKQIRKEKTKLLVSTYFGLFVLDKKENKWIFSHKIEGFHESARGFMEDDEDYNFWVSNNKIQKIVLEKDLSRVSNIKDYDSPRTTKGKNSFFRKIDNNIVFCPYSGIYRYSRISDKFEHYKELESILKGDTYYDYLNVDKMNNIWFVVNKSMKMVTSTAAGYNNRITTIGLKNKLVPSFVNITLTDSNSAIISSDNAFMKIDMANYILKQDSVKIYIRELASTKNDSIINYGINTKTPKLAYDLNSIRIRFTGTDLTQSNEILYSYKLNDIDDSWSIPSINNKKEYTNLPEGKYTFSVKAIINGDYESCNIASIEFIILPPWYRSSIAYFVYISLISGIIYFLYRKTVGRQRKIILQKGEELIAQSERFEAESKIKDREIYILQNEKLESELYHKTQELSGHLLNIVRKNEMLEDVRKTAIEIAKSIDQEEKMPTIKQKVVRLIGKINTNIEHDTDFEVFKQNFDMMHQDFFKLLGEKHPSLSRNDKILCAYLRMNLSSKEISPLLNITVRGVEVNRYRLRKKMNLDRDINLKEYIQNLKE